MEASISGINLLLKNLLFLLGECRGVTSKGRFCRYVGALTLAKLSSALSSRNGQISFSERELFLRLKHGDVWFESSLGSGELWSYIEAYSRREYDSDSVQFEPQDVILDAGANIGLFAIRYGKEFPTVPVYCFEPNPRVYKRLVRNLEANGLTNAVAINAAAGDCAGIRPFFVGRVTVTGSMTQNGNGAAEPAFNAEVIDLDAFSKAHSITSIGLLKIDVEGAEMEVLRGAQDALQVTKALMIECHSAELAASVEAFLAARGFDVTFRKLHWEGLSVVHFARPRKSALSATEGEFVWT
jgi:FkbM family methyltransferase